jgi:acetyl-CoA carboxylase carboxyl transferase subunit alpha
MMLLEVPIIAVVIGEGGSGGALGIGVADRVLILENAYYSVISPRAAPPSSGRIGQPPRKQRKH